MKGLSFTLVGMDFCHQLENIAGNLHCKESPYAIFKTAIDLIFFWGIQIPHKTFQQNRLSQDNEV